MHTNMVFHKHLASSIVAMGHIAVVFGMLRDTWNESLRCQFWHHCFFVGFLGGGVFKGRG